MSFCPDLGLENERRGFQYIFLYSLYKINHKLKINLSFL